jgi:hypothetical protein
MSDQPRAGKAPPESENGKSAESGRPGAIAKLPDGTGDASLPAAPNSPNQLTPEEQMALFEKDLKENDWGHQPC